jgi:hypothetical protein
VPPEALREDAGLLDRRCVVQIPDCDHWPDRKAPGPACALRIVLRWPRDLDDGEYRLPDGGVEDRRLAGLNGGAFRRGVRAELVR